MFAKATPACFLMAKKKSEKSPFWSHRTRGWVSAPQMLAELSCERQARAKGEPLPRRFWADPRWAREYKAAVTAATALLKSYPLPAVVAAVQSEECRDAYSLRSEWVTDRARREAERIARRKSLPPPPEPAGPGPTRPAFSTSPSPLSRLRDYDV